MDSQKDENSDEFEEKSYAPNTENYLMSQAYLYQLTGDVFFKEQLDTPANQFFIENCYSITVF